MIFMAYDPEARETSNSAMTIAIIVLVLVVGAVIAYFATRRNDVDVVTAPGPSTTIVEKTENVVPVPGQAPPPVVVTPGSTTRIEKNTTRETTKVVPSGNTTGSGDSGDTSGGTSEPGASSDTNVTVNAAPPADSGATDSGATGTGDTGSGATKSE
jgi:hypothetical protein